MSPVVLLLAVLVGVALGLLGGGGSILTVPALVYVLGQDPHAAVSGSLGIVGLNGMTGAWVHQRAGHVRLKAAALFEQHFDELALMIARETGGIIPKGQHEVREAVVLCRLAAALPMQAQGQVLPSTPGRLSIARRVPHGVVGVVSPFTFPLILSPRSGAPPLGLPPHGWRRANVGRPPQGDQGAGGGGTRRV